MNSLHFFQERTVAGLTKRIQAAEAFRNVEFEPLPEPSRIRWSWHVCLHVLNVVQTVEAACSSQVRTGLDIGITMVSVTC